MIGSLENPPITVRTSKAKILLYLLGALAFVGLSVELILRSPGASLDQKFILGSAGAFFGLIAIMGFWKMIRPLTLMISPEGLRFTTAFGLRKLAWGDISGFCTIRVRSACFVGINYTPRYTERAQARRSRLERFGAEDTLPVGWELDPEPLCKLLDAALKRWGPHR